MMDRCFLKCPKVKLRLYAGCTNTCRLRVLLHVNTFNNAGGCTVAACAATPRLWEKEKASAGPCLQLHTDTPLRVGISRRRATKNRRATRSRNKILKGYKISTSYTCSVSVAGGGAVRLPEGQHDMAGMSARGGLP